MTFAGNVDEQHELFFGPFRPGDFIENFVLLSNVTLNGIGATVEIGLFQSQPPSGFDWSESATPIPVDINNNENFLLLPVFERMSDRLRYFGLRFTSDVAMVLTVWLGVHTKAK